MTETQLQDAVLELAGTLGWLGYHTHDSRRSAAGFPDLTLVRAPRIVLAELKVGKNDRSLQQVVWGDALEHVEAAIAQPFEFVGVPLFAYRLWRDTDWLSGVIERELTARPSR